MQHQLQIEQFYFNAKTDYLPYFKKFTLKLDESDNIKTLLAAIQAKDSAFVYPKQKTLARINGALVDARITIKEVVAAFGETLTIEPASTFRVTHDMKILDDDFMQNYTLLESFCDEDDLTYYKTLYAQHYASNTQLLAPEYIGDAVLMLAKHLIDKDESRREAILELIDDKSCGIWLYEHDNTLFPHHDITPIVDSLKTMIIEDNRSCNPIQEIKKRLKITTPADDMRSAQDIAVDLNSISKPFTDFKIAYFAGMDASDSDIEYAHTLITNIGAAPITYASQRSASGRRILKHAPHIATKKAGEILLDAFDNSADIFVVANAYELGIFDREIKACERATGREIDMAVITLEQLSQIAMGNTDKVTLGLDKHKSNIQFI